jgi:hypothetical protein
VPALALYYVIILFKEIVMKKVTPVSIILLFLISLSAFADYSGGSGTEADPWQISCPNDLLYLAGHPADYNSHFILTADVNLAGYTFSTAVIAPDAYTSNGEFDGTEFTGIFNGNGFAIRNLTVDANGTQNSYLGLFGQTGPGCEIRNLGIEDVNIAGGNNSYEIGGLVGRNDSGTISNCYSSGNVAGGNNLWSLGGLAGSNYDGTINNCYAEGLVTGLGNVWGLGGLVGDNYDGTINNCCATGTVAGGSGSWCLGGLLGSNYEGEVNNCYATGSVAGSISLGGLAGDDYDGTINNCYATGTITGGYYSRDLGGLVGYNRVGTISNCCATGAITGVYYSSDLGGLVGGNGYGMIINCYATGMVTGGRSSLYLGGLAGQNYKGTISNCCATGAITGGYYSAYLGGLIGENYRGTVNNCYAMGAITGGDRSIDLGGLVGDNQVGEISNCYSTGKVIAGPSSRYLGGLVGRCNVPVRNCFWDKQASGMGRCYEEGGGVIGKTTAQMQTQSTFTDYGWDFVGETANGTEDIWFVREGKEYPKLWWQNNRPVANAGVDQTVYAWIDGFVDVNLDGSGSFDVDGDQITYQWNWSIDANTFEANGVNPTIELPVGEHTISLTVSDFLDDSEPNDVNVIVIEPIRSHLLILPRAINLKSKMPRITAMMFLPEGITKEQVDSNYRLKLYVGMSEQGNGIKAFYQRIYQLKNHGVVRTAILAFFEKFDLSSYKPAGHNLELQAVGRLATGQYFYGRDEIMVINPKPPIWKVR